MNFDFERLITAFNSTERAEAREIVERWFDYGRAARAEIRGMADRPRHRRQRAAIYEAMKELPPDGFARQYANLFGGSLEEAAAAADAAVNEAQRW